MRVRNKFPSYTHTSATFYSDSRELPRTIVAMCLPANKGEKKTCVHAVCIYE